MLTKGPQNGPPRRSSLDNIIQRGTCMPIKFRTLMRQNLLRRIWNACSVPNPACDDIDSAFMTWATLLSTSTSTSRRGSTINRKGSWQIRNTSTILATTVVVTGLSPRWSCSDAKTGHSPFLHACSCLLGQPGSPHRSSFNLISSVLNGYVFVSGTAWDAAISN